MKFTDIFTESAYNLHQLYLLNDHNGVKLNLSNTDLSDTDLTRANLSRANLYNANLTDANLTRADLYGADLTDANLTRADLYCADLYCANLTRANLTRADLTDANLTRADLTDANLTRADLSRANLSRANLSRADLTDIIFNYLIGDDITFKNITLPTYKIVLFGDILAIGCKTYSVKEWYDFDDTTISNMDVGALDWWNKYKDLIKVWIEIR